MGRVCSVEVVGVEHDKRLGVVLSLEGIVLRAEGDVSILVDECPVTGGVDFKRGEELEVLCELLDGQSLGIRFVPAQLDSLPGFVGVNRLEP